MLHLPYVDTAVAVLLAIADQLPPHHAARRRAELEELLTHILAARTRTRRYTPRLTELAAWAADRLKEVGDLTRAINIHTRLTAETEHALGPDHPDTLTSRHRLAATHWSAGHHHDAIGLDEQNLADRERVL